MKLHSNPINKIDQNDPLDFPVYVYEDGLVLPKTGNYYLITGDGFWLHKDIGLVYGFVKVDGIGFMKKMQARVGLRIPKIPVQIVWQALTFFRSIYNAHHSEAILMLVYHQEKGGFGLICPEQEVGHSRIKYNKDVKVSDDLSVVGTFHSHCDFGSFHSSVDCKDEKHFDGLHITFGNVNSQDFTLTASIAINNNRAKISPAQYLDGVEKISGGLVSDDRHRFALSKAQLKALKRKFGNNIAKWSDKVKKFGMGYSATCCHQKNHESTLHNAGTVGNIPPVSSVDEKQRQFHEGDRTEAAK